jgi:hypothetical protein
MSIKYRGPAIVFKGITRQRDSTNGFWSTTWNYEGITDAIQAVALAVTPGPGIAIQHNGPTSNLAITYGGLTDSQVDNTISTKWEVDRENIDKDLLFFPAVRAISDQGIQEYKRWRADPGSDFDTSSGGSAEGIAALESLKILTLRGAEAHQVSTLILKRTRTISSQRAPVLTLTEQTSFYSTATLITNESIPSDLASTLPTSPYTKPSQSEWGWLPRLANRTYIGRGQVEEQNDWVFAAWSTFLYTYVP